MQCKGFFGMQCIWWRKDKHLLLVLHTHSFHPNNFTWWRIFNRFCGSWEERFLRACNCKITSFLYTSRISTPWETYLTLCKPCQIGPLANTDILVFASFPSYHGYHNLYRHCITFFYLPTLLKWPIHTYEHKNLAPDQIFNWEETQSYQ